MRERELKPCLITGKPSACQSLPMRERELKRRLRQRLRAYQKSLPMRERELKPTTAMHGLEETRVAPHAGARIETPNP